MRYFTSIPPERLKPYVRCFWVFEHDLSKLEPNYIFRSVADGCAEIIFHYQGIFNDISDNNGGNKAEYLSGLHAQTSHYSRFITNENFGIFGAYLYPYAIPQFFDIPADETTNNQLDLKTLLGAEGRYLEERIMLAPDNNERVNILSAFLINQLSKSCVLEKSMMMAVQYAIHNTGSCKVNEMSAKFCLSTRQFDRKFKIYSGFTPKTYLRLTRLQRALKLYDNDKSLTQVAYECGYYDQSHFIHDRKEFTGYHPGYYFSGNAEGTEFKNI